MRLGQSEGAGCNTDVLVRHDGAEIDKWMFGSGGIQEGGGGGGQMEGAELI